ncbi:S-layer homology domain-containing protein [Saccharibacillus qingshengii]|uniref:S-layer homology domain-containing protein n=1 Tax=Saccharibacillus qingshengii TaxID=1763540 RepID=UPI001556DA8B|nr:S-layer homology domain-containing protein [Saccharibacillus qingshengii]
MQKKLISLAIAVALTSTTSAFAAAKSFTDVPANSWSYSVINWSTQQAIAKGYPNGTFKPDKTVSEEEFLSMLIRAYGDVPDTTNPPYWSSKYYTKAKSLNYPVSTQRTAVITRTKVAEIVAGTQGKNYSGTNAIKYMLANGLASGKSGSTVAGYQGSDSLTRAEAVAFIKRVIDNRASDELLPRPSKPSSEEGLGLVPEGNAPSGFNKDVLVISDGAKPDATLVKRGNAVSKALAGTGLTTLVNVEQNALGIKDPKTGNVIFVFADNSYKDAAYGVVIKYDYLVDTGAKDMRADYVSAMTKAMKALGIDGGTTFTKTLDAADYDGKSRTFTAGGKTYHINPVNAGQGVISE